MDQGTEDIWRMMMEKNKSKTYLERLGFGDTDLKTPEHDKMCLWVYTHPLKVLQTLPINLTPLVGINLRSRSSCHYAGDQQCNGECLNIPATFEKCKYLTQSNQLKEIAKNSKDEPPELIWEYPIMSNQYIIGYIDMKIEDSRYFRALCNKYSPLTIHKFPRVLIEIKPEINSIGETIRQINTYKRYESGNYIIVTKTKGLKQLFLEQGIHIYEFEEEKEEDKKGGIDDTDPIKKEGV